MTGCHSTASNPNQSFATPQYNTPHTTRVHPIPPLPNTTAAPLQPRPTLTPPNLIPIHSIAASKGRMGMCYATARRSLLPSLQISPSLQDHGAS